MKTDNLQRFLNSFGKNVIKQSRASLTRNKKNVSKELYNALKLKKMGKILQLNFLCLAMVLL